MRTHAAGIHKLHSAALRFALPGGICVTSRRHSHNRPRLRQHLSKPFLQCLGMLESSLPPLTTQRRAEPYDARDKGRGTRRGLQGGSAPRLPSPPSHGGTPDSFRPRDQESVAPRKERSFSCSSWYCDWRVFLALFRWCLGMVERLHISWQKEVMSTHPCSSGCRRLQISLRCQSSTTTGRTWLTAVQNSSNVKAPSPLTSKKRKALQMLLRLRWRQTWNCIS
mmetsp:Transcript_101504/g.295819  ORF Transcript_101504/g.295819 Transcript_101504/m.295819 type:complete len:223 (+) Transcript_101504:94-762(+)